MTITTEATGLTDAGSRSANDDIALLTSLSSGRDAATRRLAEILPPANCLAPDHLDIRQLLNHLESGGENTVLYKAWRDILAPRSKHSLAEARDEDCWYADLVRYRHGTLADGQPVRSRGHWNAPGQVELFQTLTGRTLMLVALRTPAGRDHVATAVCEPGQVYVVPCGAWHVTYVLEGPALVFNIYTDAVPDARGARGAALDPQLKYHRQAPPAVSVRRTADSVLSVATAGADRVRAERSMPLDTGQAAEWAVRWIPQGASLADFYEHGDTPELENLLAAASTDPTTGWSLHQLDR